MVQYKFNFYFTYLLPFLLYTTRAESLFLTVTYSVTVRRDFSLNKTALLVVDCVDKTVENNDREKCGIALHIIDFFIPPKALGNR